MEDNKKISKDTALQDFPGAAVDRADNDTTTPELVDQETEIMNKNRNN